MAIDALDARNAHGIALAIERQVALQVANRDRRLRPPGVDRQNGGHPRLGRSCLGWLGGHGPPRRHRVRPGRVGERLQARADVVVVLTERDKAGLDGGAPSLEGLEGPGESGDAFVKLVAAVFDHTDRNARPDPGRVTMRRLNRNEYKNTVRDLVGVDFNPTEGFPADDIGHGFDNIGDVLTLSPLLMERYLDAAETIAKRVILVVLFDQRATLGLVKLKAKNVVGALNKVFEEMFNRVGTGQAQQPGLLEGAEDEIDKLFG